MRGPTYSIGHRCLVGTIHVSAALGLGLASINACGSEAGGTGSQGTGTGSQGTGTGTDSQATDTGSQGDCEFPTSYHYRVSDTNLDKCYGGSQTEITCPDEGEDFYGQDAQYHATPPSYSLACDDTVVFDNNTGLAWERAHHGERVGYQEALQYCESLELGGEDDWRVPTIKELLSISDWRGSQNIEGAFYLDDNYFDFDYPDLSEEELMGSHTNRMMGQTWSSTSRPDSADLNREMKYFNNFLDAHIKSQSADNPNAKLFYRCVHGDETALNNDFLDGGDGTVTDAATGLMWQQANGEENPGDYQFDWRNALSYCEDLSLAGYDDWRLPDVKELQSIVDYIALSYATSRTVVDLSVFEFNLPAGKDLNTPPTTSPPDGQSVAPFFWSSTSHGDSLQFASYVCFGPCWAVEELGHNWDMHGPGAQRADPKDDQMGALWDRIGSSIGDQKDVVQVNNFVRCLRNVE